MAQSLSSPHPVGLNAEQTGTEQRQLRLEKVGVIAGFLLGLPLALAEVGVAPEDAVFLDDLGVNLRPARELGMATIKVVDPDEAMELGMAYVEFDVPAGWRHIRERHRHGP
mgnify:CR=1 FL=1